MMLVLGVSACAPEKQRGVAPPLHMESITFICNQEGGEMLRLILIRAGLASLMVSAALASAAEKDVIAKSGGHRWEFMGMPSPAAAVGKPEGRLQVPVRNGDIVR